MFVHVALPTTFWPCDGERRSGQMDADALLPPRSFTHHRPLAPRSVLWLLCLLVLQRRVKGKPVRKKRGERERWRAAEGASSFFSTAHVFRFPSLVFAFLRHQQPHLLLHQPLIPLLISDVGRCADCSRRHEPANRAQHLLAEVA